MKIVGIVLLALLGLVLFLLILVLFVPYTYRLAGSCHDRKLRLRGNVSVLAGLLGVGLEVKDRRWMTFLRILGIRRRLGQTKNKPEKKRRKKKPESKPKMQPEPVREPEPEIERREPELRPEPVREPETEIERTEPERKPGLWQRITGFWRRCKNIWQNLTAALHSFRETAGSIIGLVTDKENQQGVRALGSWVFRLLRYLTPRRMKLTLAYSTGSPDTTGQLLGVFALFPLGYQNRWKITPDFEADEFYVETDFDVRGHILGIQILYVAVRILLDKDCQKLYNKIS